MNGLKRIPVKYVRDWIKKDYSKKDACYVCGATEDLELHHLYSVSELFHSWCTKNDIKEITTVEQISELRVIFAKDCEEELSHKHLFTLCKAHHERLHNIYGQRYTNTMTPKVLRWLNIQRDKFIGK